MLPIIGSYIQNRETSSKLRSWERLIWRSAINLESETISRSQSNKKRWRQDLSRQWKQTVKRPRDRREIVPLQELKEAQQKRKSTEQQGEGQDMTLEMETGFKSRIQHLLSIISLSKSLLLWRETRSPKSSGHGWGMRVVVHIKVTVFAKQITITQPCSYFHESASPQHGALQSPDLDILFCCKGQSWKGPWKSPSPVVSNCTSWSSRSKRVSPGPLWDWEERRPGGRAWALSARASWGLLKFLALKQDLEKHRYPTDENTRGPDEDVYASAIGRPFYQLPDSPFKNITLLSTVPRENVNPGVLFFPTREVNRHAAPLSQWIQKPGRKGWNSESPSIMAGMPGPLELLFLSPLLPACWEPSQILPTKALCLDGQTYFLLHASPLIQL